jgi:hypothetical protein
MEAGETAAFRIGNSIPTGCEACGPDSRWFNEASKGLSLRLREIGKNMVNEINDILRASVAETYRFTAI